MSTQTEIDEIQQEIRNLQGAAVPDTLRRRLQELSSHLQVTPRAEFGRQPRQRNVPIITPTPPPTGLDPMELPVWDMFTDYHTALCQYAGAANRDQWIHMMDIAADMTSATYGAFMPVPQPPATGGPWGWNSDTQTWVLVAPFPPMGVTDGGDAVAGEIGEYVKSAAQFHISTRLNENAWDQVPLDPVGSLNLTPGDWMCGAWLLMEEIGQPTTYVNAVFQGPTEGSQWFIRQVTAQDLANHFTPLRASSNSPMVINLSLQIVTTGAPALVSVPIWSEIWARRMR